MNSERQHTITVESEQQQEDEVAVSASARENWRTSAEQNNRTEFVAEPLSRYERQFCPPPACSSASSSADVDQDQEAGSCQQQPQQQLPAGDRPAPWRRFCAALLRSRSRPRLLRLSYLRNSASFLVFSALLVAANVAMFSTRVLQYTDKHWLEQMARGTGFCLNLDCALVLVLVLRRLLTWLRSRNIGHLLPLEHHVHLHKMVGWTVFALSIVHTLFHMANFVNMSEHSGVSVYDYLFDTSMQIGWFAGSANITGIALLAILTVMVACSHRAVRKSGYFEVFYWTHLLSVPTWVLLVLHAPHFWRWLLVPGALFVLEIGGRMRRVLGRRGQTVIKQAAIMPSNVVRLTVERPGGFNFQSGDFCYINIPLVAKYEWHPFTISSSPENSEEITFHVRAVGEWTRSLLSRCQQHSVDQQFMLKQRSCLTHAHHHHEDNDDVASNTQQQQQQQQQKRMSASSSPAVTSTLAQLKLARRGLHHTGHDNPAFQPCHHVPTRGTTCEPVAVATVVGKQQEEVGMVVGKKKQEEVGCQGQPVRRRKTGSNNNSSKTTICDQLNWRVILDGPFGAPCTGIFHSQHAVLIAAGIGVTPFASVLHCIVDRYNAAHKPCPHCNVPTCLEMPSSLFKLRKVEFLWVNREMRSFEWFLELLAELRESQRRPGSHMDTFLDIQLYRTSNSPLKKPLPLQTAVRQGRPDWDQVFRRIRENKAGRVSVFYCGPAALVPILREKSTKYGFAFVKEMF